MPVKKSTRPELTQARLKELFHYDPDTGSFIEQRRKRMQHTWKLNQDCIHSKLLFWQGTPNAKSSKR